MTDLNTLASMVEAATGPDRELDALICLALGLSGGNPIVAPGMAGWLVGSETNPNPVQSLCYTASLDAAMTLVPEGKPWSVTDPANADGRRSVFGYSSRCYASVEGGPNHLDYAATPALALCAAALRSRAAMGDG